MSTSRIMVVEDEFIEAKCLKRSLENLGYSVSTIVDTGEKAIKKAEQDKPDLTLMDIELKGRMDGIEAAGIILSRFDIPVIYLTAFMDEKILERAKVTEPFGYMIKPFENKELNSTIEMAIYKHRVEKERKKLTQELQEALTKVKMLTGLLPICASCKNIRDTAGHWNHLESYIKDHSEAEFSHGICPDCAKKLYPEFCS